MSEILQVPMVVGIGGGTTEVAVISWAALLSRSLLELLVTSLTRPFLSMFVMRNLLLVSAPQRTSRLRLALQPLLQKSLTLRSTVVTSPVASQRLFVLNQKILSRSF